MRLQRTRPTKNTHNQIIDAIFETVMRSCSLRRPGGRFEIKVADLPEAANGFTHYDLERVSLRLNIRGVKVRSMAMHSDTFYFYKP